MKRDMDIVRRIALETADLPHGQSLIEIEGVDDAAFGVHAIWMEEAGLIKAAIQEFQSGEPPKAFVRRLTWEGCEFADAVRSETIWKNAKESVIKPATSFTFSILKEWLKTEIAQGFPTARATN